MNMVNDYIRMVGDKRIIFYHAGAWAAFISYEVLTLYFVVGRAAPAADYILHYLINICLFYYHARIIIKTRSVLGIALKVILEIGVYLIINYWLNRTLEHFYSGIIRPVDPLKGFFVASFWRCLYFIGLSTLYGLAFKLIQSRDKINAMLINKFESEKNKISLERDLLVTKNALLRAQINPHLFFNTLNFIYNSVYRVSAYAGEAVMLLADITRYSISKGDDEGMVLLQDELNNINDLIALNQIRFDDRLHIKFETNGDLSDFKIIPLVLLTFVENVFKYADLFDKSAPAVIHINVLNDIVHFATRNKKLQDSLQEPGTGIGISNARFRLSQAYPGKFILRINETKEMFYVDLSINIDCLCLVATS